MSSNSSELFLNSSDVFSNLSIASNTWSNSTQTMDAMDDPIFYVYLFEAVTYWPAFISQATLLYQIKKNKLASELSANMLINIVCWTLFLFVGICCSSYMIPRLESSFKSYYIVTGLSFAIISTNLTLSTSVFFMTVDRIFALIWSLSYKLYRRSFVSCTLCGCLISLFICPAALVIFEPWPTSQYTACKSGSCIVSARVLLINNSTRLILGVLVVTVSVIFNVTLYRHWNKEEMPENTREQFKRANYLVLVACWMEFLVNVLPQVFFVGLVALGISILKLGPFTTALVGIEAMTNAFIYRFLIMRRLKSFATQVHPINSNSDSSKYST